MNKSTLPAVDPCNLTKSEVTTLVRILAFAGSVDVVTCIGEVIPSSAKQIACPTFLRLVRAGLVDASKEMVQRVSIGNRQRPGPNRVEVNLTREGMMALDDLGIAV